MTETIKAATHYHRCENCGLSKPCAGKTCGNKIPVAVCNACIEVGISRITGKSVYSHTAVINVSRP